MARRPLSCGSRHAHQHHPWRRPCDDRRTRDRRHGRHRGGSRHHHHLRDHCRTGLAISAPTSKALGSANLDATSVAAALGTVRVDDTRAGLLSSWTATASSSDFIYDADESDLTTDDRNVISNSAVNYDPGALPTGSSLVLTVPVPGTSGSLASPRTAFAVVSVTGSNWVEWNPTVTVALPASGKVAGTYTGTIIHSVS